MKIGPGTYSALYYNSRYNKTQPQLHLYSTIAAILDPRTKATETASLYLEEQLASSPRSRIH
eukprot:COSAG05_NODE_4619_length_1435_cov_29.002246_1_plen_61_part_10